MLKSGQFYTASKRSEHFTGRMYEWWIWTIKRTWYHLVSRNKLSHNMTTFSCLSDAVDKSWSHFVMYYLGKWYVSRHHATENSSVVSLKLNTFIAALVIIRQKSCQKADKMVSTKATGTNCGIFPYDGILLSYIKATHYWCKE